MSDVILPSPMDVKTMKIPMLGILPLEKLYLVKMFYDNFFNDLFLISSTDTSTMPSSGHQANQSSQHFEEFGK